MGAASCTLAQAAQVIVGRRQRITSRPGDPAINPHSLLLLSNVAVDKRWLL